MMLLTMTDTRRKRSDHRTTPAGGPLGHYLLNDYLLKRDWCPDGPVLVMEQSHETERNSSGYVHLEGGKPAMKRGWLNHLSGYPWQAVAYAIELVRATDPDCIAALEYYQLPASRRPSRYAWAAQMGCGEQTISDWFKRAIRKVGEHLWLARKEYEERRR